MTERKSTTHKPIVVGIGELLWDIFPKEKSLGGAPANFAFHANQLGAASYVVSTVGDDELGREAGQILKQKGIHLNFLTSTSEHPTGTASIQMDEEGNHGFRIHEHVAWDHLPWSESLRQLARQADAVCFGSLAQRAPETRQTLRNFLDATRPACLRIFDINLRHPYPNRATLLDSLQRANVLKLNEDELSYLAQLLGLKGPTAENLFELVGMFDLDLVALTRAEEGSILTNCEELVQCPGFAVDLQDSVGAGDAFTAALTIGYLRRFPLARISTIACRTAAQVCSGRGAMVTFPPRLIREFESATGPIAEYEPPRTSPRASGPSEDWLESDDTMQEV